MCEFQTEYGAYRVTQKNAICKRGRFWITILCPFCEKSFGCLWWTFLRKGKKCPECGSLHVMDIIARSVKPGSAFKGSS